MSTTAKILRYHAREDRVFDTENDTVIVSRTLLSKAADELVKRTEALQVVAKMIKGEAIEHAIIDMQSLASLSDVVRAALSDEQHQSAPRLGASQNTAERLPSSDAAESGADAHSSAIRGDDNG